MSDSLRNNLLLSIEHNIEWISSNLLLQINNELLKEDISSYLYYYKSCSAHKMCELSLGAIDFIKAGKSIAAANLIRATLETAASLHYIDRTMFKSLGERDTTSILACLEKLVKRDEEFVNFVPNLKNSESSNVVESFTKEMIKMAALEEQHNWLSEVVHPNASGSILYYTAIDNEASLAYLGYKNFITEEEHYQNGLKDLCLLFLKEALACFRASFINIQNYKGELNECLPCNQKMLFSLLVKPDLSAFKLNILSLPQEKSFLEFIHKFIKYLEATLVKELNLEIFRAGIRGQLLHYKSVMAHRIQELSVLALEKMRHLTLDRQED